MSRCRCGRLRGNQSGQAARGRLATRAGTRSEGSRSRGIPTQSRTYTSMDRTGSQREAARGRPRRRPVLHGDIVPETNQDRPPEGAWRHVQEPGQKAAVAEVYRHKAVRIHPWIVLAHKEKRREEDPGGAQYCMAISSRETGKPLAMEMVPVGNHHAEKQGIQPEMRGREVPLPVKRHNVWVPLPGKRYHGFGVCQARHQHRGRHRHKHLWNGREWVVLAIYRLSDHKEQRQRQEDIEMLFHGKRPEVPRRSLPVALDKKEVVHNEPPDLVLDGKWML